MAARLAVHERPILLDPKDCRHAFDNLARRTRHFADELLDLFVRGRLALLPGLRDLRQQFRIFNHGAKCRAQHPDAIRWDARRHHQRTTELGAADIECQRPSAFGALGDFQSLSKLHR
jgi:hypothetical protein